MNDQSNQVTEYKVIEEKPVYRSVEAGEKYREYLSDIYGIGFDGDSLSINKPIKGIKIC